VLAPFVVGTIGDAAAGEAAADGVAAGEAEDGATLWRGGAIAGLCVPGVFIGGLGMEGPLGRPVNDGLMTVGVDASDPVNFAGC